MTGLSGKTVGDYQLQELIDDAGSASVYKGVQTSTNRPVAIKVLKPEVASDQTAVQAFVQFAEMAGRMSHPNLLQVLDSGQEGGIEYVVTPYMAYRSVAQQRSSYSTPVQVSALFRALAPGLEYIYSQGTIHGKLCPTNIILDAQKEPRLTNFGVAFRQGETPTPYNSPEQVRGGVVDLRTDIFALGVILYELLAGQKPLPGSTLNLQSVRPDLPTGIDQVVQKATAQNPDQRFQTLGEFLSAFTKVMQPVQEPIAAPPPAPAPAPTPSPAAPPQKGTNWMGFILGGLVVIVLCLVVVVVGPMVYDALNPQADQPLAEQPIVEEPIVEEPVVEEPVVEPPEIEPPEVELPQPEEGAPEEGAPEERALPEGAGEGLQQVCGSLGGAAGIVLLPGFFALKRRRKP